MEKRWCERIPVSLNVEILYKGNKVGKCRAKDISLRGICLNSGPIAFHENTSLTLKFADASYLSGNKNTMNAIVVRNSHREIGLTFDPTEPDIANTIIRNSRIDNSRTMIV